jgi:hypothetical protein
VTAAATSGLRPAPSQNPDPRPSSAIDTWRAWRVPLALIALVIAGGTLIALLQPAAVNSYLNPAGDGPVGTHAIADILAARGRRVVTTTTPAATSSAARSAPSTVVITSPQYLTEQQLSALTQLPGDLVVVEPDQANLAALIPGAIVTGSFAVQPLQPGCSLAAARLAGNADMGGSGLRLPSLTPGAKLCYPVAGQPTLVQYSVGRKVMTILGSGQLLTNQSLGRLGNASLALNLLESNPRIVWLVPSPAIQAAPRPAVGQRSLASLLPIGAWLVALQLAIAVLLTALWRARRLGPVITEHLPVQVRAAETIEGHARLYQSRRARGQAAAALRAATVSRLSTAVGVPPGGTPETLTAALVARSGLSADYIDSTLFGPAPPDDTALIRLADELDALERQVRTQ